MNTKLERNLKLMMVRSIFLEPLFWGPILILALEKLAHMKLSEIYLLEAVCIIFMLIIDIPTGALADIIGRKQMIVIGQCFMFADFIFFASMSRPWHACMANFLWAIGAAFQSGADKALIQESCISLGKDRGFYRKYEGKAFGLRLLLFAICAPVTSWVATYNLRLPLLMSLPFIIIPLVTSFMLTEPPRTEEKEFSTHKHLMQMKEGLLDTIRDKRILWIMLYMCVIGVTSKIWFFTYNPYFEYVGLPLTLFGWVFFFLNVIAWLSSHWGHIIEDRLGDKIIVWFLIPLIGLPIIMMSLVPIQAMTLMVVFQNIVRGMHGPFFDSMSGRYLRNNTRATVLSVQSSIMSVTGSIGLLGFGFLLKSVGLLNSLLMLGIITLVCHTLLMRTWGKHFNR